jgi:hypothetical protein
MVAEMLRLPSEEYLAEQASLTGGANVIVFMRPQRASTLGSGSEPLARYQGLNIRPYAPDADR